MSRGTGKILAVTAEVIIYSSSAKNNLLFHIPEAARKALAHPSPIKGTRVYVVLKDSNGNLIAEREVALVSGLEVYKSNFIDEISRLKPGQHIHVEVSREQLSP